MKPEKFHPDFLVPKVSVADTICHPAAKPFQPWHALEQFARGIVFLILVGIWAIFFGSLMLVSDRFVKSINSLDDELEDHDSSS